MVITKYFQKLSSSTSYMLINITSLGNNIILDQIRSNLRSRLKLKRFRLVLRFGLLSDLSQICCFFREIFSAFFPALDFANEDNSN